MGPLTNGALCLSTPNHNGKSGTADMAGLLDIFIFYIYSSYDNVFLLKLRSLSLRGEGPVVRRPISPTAH